MTEQTLTRARAGDEDAFRELTDPYRRELHRHIYRIVGRCRTPRTCSRRRCSPPGAASSGSRSAPRCAPGCTGSPPTAALDALRGGRRRPRGAANDRHARADPPGEPSGSSPTRTPARGRPRRRPAPRRATRPGRRSRSRSSPASSTSRRSSARCSCCATCSASGRRGRRDARDQRGVGQQPAAPRARRRSTRACPPTGRDRAPLPNSPLERDLVGRFADAVEAGDIDGMVALLTDDAWLTMPPEPLEYQGPAAIGAFLRDREERARRAAAARADARQHASPRSGATSPSPIPASRGPSRCSSSRSRATGSPR